MFNPARKMGISHLIFIILGIQPRVSILFEISTLSQNIIQRKGSLMALRLYRQNYRVHLENVTLVLWHTNKLQNHCHSGEGRSPVPVRLDSRLRGNDDPVICYWDQILVIL